MNTQKPDLYKDFSLVDLFCGVGGLTHGFKLENFKVEAGIDFDNSCKFAYEQNNTAPFLHKDVVKLDPEELTALYTKGKRKILVGCAPCQPFSIFNHKNSQSIENQKSGEKWKLLYSFADLIEKTEPEIISMENVPLLLKFDGGRVFNDFVERLEKNDYKVTYYIVNAQDYGVPQRRKRLILFGSKHGKIQLVDKFVKDGNYQTVRKAIGHLPELQDGATHPSDPLHKARKLTDLSKKRILASKPGGTWRDWDESLKLECHKRDGGRLFGSVYGRMKWDDVSPTMTTYCNGVNNGRFGHPEQLRGISLREAALLQSFPENYQFMETNSPLSSQAIARQIGNAVPVGLGVAIAKSIKNHIEENIL